MLINPYEANQLGNNNCKIHFIRKEKLELFTPNVLSDLTALIKLTKNLVHGLVYKPTSMILIEMTQHHEFIIEYIKIHTILK